MLRLTADDVQGNFKWHQYQVVGRLLPTDSTPEPTVYRMKIWATDAVRARSRFWCAIVAVPLDVCSCVLLVALRPYKQQRTHWACRYFLSRLRKVKKANGQILAINEVRVSHTAVCM